MTIKFVRKQRKKTHHTIKRFDLQFDTFLLPLFLYIFYYYIILFFCHPTHTHNKHGVSASHQCLILFSRLLSFFLYIRSFFYFQIQNGLHFLFFFSYNSNTLMHHIYLSILFSYIIPSFKDVFG